MDIEKIRFTNKNLNIIQTHPKYIGSGRSGCSGLAHLKLEVAMWQLILHIYIYIYIAPKKIIYLQLCYCIWVGLYGQSKC